MYAKWKFENGDAGRLQKSSSGVSIDWKDQY